MDNVTVIRSDVIVSEGKQTFLDNVADAFDEMVAMQSGVEPICIVFGLVGPKGACRTGYHTLGQTEETNCLFISRAIMALNADAAIWDAPAD